MRSASYPVPVMACIEFVMFRRATDGRSSSRRTTVQTIRQEGLPDCRFMTTAGACFYNEHQRISPFIVVFWQSYLTLPHARPRDCIYRNPWQQRRQGAVVEEIRVQTRSSVIVYARARVRSFTPPGGSAGSKDMRGRTATQRSTATA